MLGVNAKVDIITFLFWWNCILLWLPLMSYAIILAFKGPNKMMIRDFWRMVWQQRVSKIVMLTNLVEACKVSALDSQLAGTCIHLRCFGCEHDSFMVCAWRFIHGQILTEILSLCDAVLGNSFIYIYHFRTHDIL